MIRRILSVLHARNLEFVRDRPALGWNILLPIMLVVGLGIIFSGGDRDQFKVGVHADGPLQQIRHPFLATRFVDFFPVPDVQQAVQRLRRHQIDLVLDFTSDPPRYWVNPESPGSYVAERLLLASDPHGIHKASVTGQAIRYVDWLLPGVLGMNMMFSCMFGVGYVVVRYRKNGYLKRLNATPLRAVEFVTAQILSRLILTMAVTVFVFLGLKFTLGVPMEGSYLLLFVTALLGAITLIAMGLVVAARVSSEELAGGLLNMVSWPMMLLSGVWFSLEGTNPVVQGAAQLLPLTQLLKAARAIMIDGAGWASVAPQLLILAAAGAGFLALGAALFRWRQD